MRASTLAFYLAITAALVGMVWGMAMAISENHATMPAHAHFNLLGWIALFLFGIFYHLHPSIDGTRASLIQVCIWAVAVAVMAVGVGLVTLGVKSAEPVAAIGSILTIIDLLFFGYLAVRTRQALE